MKYAEDKLLHVIMHIEYFSLGKTNVKSYSLKNIKNRSWSWWEACPKSMMTTLRFPPQCGCLPSCHGMLRPPIPALAATAETVTRAPLLRPARLPSPGKSLAPILARCPGREPHPQEIITLQHFPDPSRPEQSKGKGLVRKFRIATDQLWREAWCRGCAPGSCWKSAVSSTSPPPPDRSQPNGGLAANLDQGVDAGRPDELARHGGSGGEPRRLVQHQPANVWAEAQGCDQSLPPRLPLQQQPAHGSLLIHLTQVTCSQRKYLHV